MNKGLKKLSAFLAVLMMTSTAAATVGAADLSYVRNTKNSGKTEETKTPAIVDSGDNYKAYSDGTFYYNGYYYYGYAIDDITDATTEVEKPSLSSASIIKRGNGSFLDDAKDLMEPIYKRKASRIIKPSYTYRDCKNIYFNKYYSYADAKKELSKFFENNTYSITMFEGEGRYFDSDAYFVSTDSSIVYFDESDNCLVAAERGSAYVYVYTKGGIPFMRLDVTVVSAKDVKKNDVNVRLIPDSWHLEGEGDSTGFSFRSNGYYSMSDFTLSIVYGSDIAKLTKDGKLVATGTGTVIVRASLKENSDIYDDAIIYIGKYVSSIYDGYYTKNDKYLIPSFWDYNISDIKDCYISGWYKSDEGTLIPVLTKGTVTVVNDDGTTREATVIGFENLTTRELLYKAYGDKAELSKILRDYNASKYCRADKTFDYFHFILSRAFD